MSDDATVQRDLRFDVDERTPLMRIAWTVDVGFATLLVVCALRYFSIHPFGERGATILALAVATGSAYAVAVLWRPSHLRARAGLLAAICIWLPLMFLAPSFAWTAFALFFAVHRVLPRRAAPYVSGVIVLAVSGGMYVLSDGQDPGLVLGPLLGGLVLSFCFTQLEHTLENRRQLIHELVETQAHLARSEREAGALAERSRVAGELHDTAVQRTATALLLLESAAEEPARVDQAREVLREALVETRQLMHGLTQPRATQVTFAETIAALASEYRASFAVVGEARTLTEEVSHVLLRVCQESLINARKHAQATRVSVTLTFFDEAVGIDVADDGVGFDRELIAMPPRSHAPDHSGYGLTAMMWRVTNSGGSLAIESTPGEGTAIAAMVPTEDTAPVPAYEPFLDSDPAPAAEPVPESTPAPAAVRQPDSGAPE